MSEMKPVFSEARVLAAAELHAGLSAEFERDISEQDIYTFAANSGDANPLHVDIEYAEGSNFQGRIVHGAFQVGLASCLIGMHLPGRNVLLGSVSARFPKPLYYPCRVRVSGQITAWSERENSGTLRVGIIDVASQIPTAEIHLGFTFHSQKESAGTHAAAIPARERDPDRPIVLVTGGSGGLGGAIVEDIADDYTVLALTRSHRIDGGDNIESVNADLNDPSWTQAVELALAGAPVYAVVHLAWPGLPTGGLLQIDAAVLDQQVAFGTAHTIALARFLASHAEPAGGRMIALSSIAATSKPVLSLAAYSLGKATLEHTVRLLAPELARKNITINAVSPSFIAAGMNKHTTDRQQLREKALVPLGRLCEPADVSGLVRFLLSPEAAFISGQVIRLTGAQL